MKYYMTYYFMNIYLKFSMDNLKKKKKTLNVVSPRDTMPVKAITNSAVIKLIDRYILYLMLGKCMANIISSIYVYLY